MSPLVQVGVSHKTAPLDVREALARVDRPKLIRRLLASGCSEAVALSTCNRFELYAAGDAGRALRAVEEAAGRGLAGSVATRRGPAAARHLFEVASGLDSLVVGETEILGQVKSAYEESLALGATGKLLNVLFQRALYVGKLVRRSTRLADGQVSVASAAVDLAGRIFGDLAGCRALVLGAGQVAKACARHLIGRGAARLTIANRTEARARDLAAAVDPARRAAEVVPWEGFPSRLESVDIVIASTGSARPILDVASIAAAARARKGRSLFVIDLAMPRDVDEEVHGLEHVYLYRLEDLESLVAENLRGREGEVSAARAVAAGKAAEFAAWLGSLEAGGEISLRHAPRAPAAQPG